MAVVQTRRVRVIRLIVRVNPYIPTNEPSEKNKLHKSLQQIYSISIIRLLVVSHAAGTTIGE